MDFEYGTISYDENTAICKVVFSKPTPLHKALLESVYLSCNTLSFNKPYYLITDVDAEVRPTKEAYEFYASIERAQHILKEVFIVKSTSMKLAANFYFRTMKPHVKGKAFSTEKEAIEWLLND